MNYPNNANCTWHIQVGHRQIIRFRIIQLAVEGPAGNCLYDAVRVYGRIRLKTENDIFVATCLLLNVLGGPDTSGELLGRSVSVKQCLTVRV